VWLVSLKDWVKRMGTGSTLAGFAKLPIPNPFKYILKFSKKKHLQHTGKQ
jgi:hypothetical protein